MFVFLLFSKDSKILNMHPDLFGIEGFSMTLMIIVGVIAAAVLLFVFLHFKGVKSNSFLDLIIVIVATVFVGIVFAILFENIYEAVKHSINKEPQKWTLGMTFYGGLFGGVLTFLLMYKFYFLRHNEPILDKIIVIAPACITLGHAFGRIGCFLSGCCYGIETDSSIGVTFPGHSHAVLPTQLIECVFLFILTAVLVIFAFKYNFLYNFVIYAGFYGIFRFIIEFFRGDERGQLAGLSPSQYWCLLLIVGSVPLYILLKKLFAKHEVVVDD